MNLLGRCSLTGKMLVPWVKFLVGFLCMVPLTARVYVEDYDFSVLRTFTGLFPREPLSKLIKAYFTYIGHDSTPEDEEEDEDSHLYPDTDDPYDLILVSLRERWLLLAYTIL